MIQSIHACFSNWMLNQEWNSEHSSGQMALSLGAAQNHCLSSAYSLHFSWKWQLAIRRGRTAAKALTFEIIISVNLRGMTGEAIKAVCSESACTSHCPHTVLSLHHPLVMASTLHHHSPVTYLSSIDNNLGLLEKEWDKLFVLHLPLGLSWDHQA